MKGAEFDKFLEDLQVVEGILDSLYCSESAVASGIEINQESRVTLLDIAFRRVFDARRWIEAQEENKDRVCAIAG